MLGPVPGQGGRRAAHVGGEILPGHVYCNEEKTTVWITLGFSSF
jgi:hypothetical protein